MIKFALTCSFSCYLEAISIKFTLILFCLVFSLDNDVTKRCIYLFFEISSANSNVSKYQSFLFPAMRAFFRFFFSLIVSLTL